MHRRLTNFLMLKYLNDNGQNLIDNAGDRKKQLAYLEKQNEEKSKKNLHNFPRSPTFKVDQMKFSPRPSAHMSYRVPTETKQKLHNLTYSQKIIYITSLVQELEKLVKINGYFYITEPMLQYDLEEPIISELILHYGLHDTRPIHPIHRNTKIEQELQFITELKKTLKQIFPTVDLGSTKTVLGLKTHLLKLQKCLSSRKIKSQSMNKNNDFYETRTERGADKSVEVSQFHHNELRGDHLNWSANNQNKLRIKPRFSVAEPPKNQLHSLENTLTQNSSCIFQQSNCQSESEMKISKCSTHNENDEKRLIKTTEHPFQKHSIHNRKAYHNFQDEVNNLFVSSLSFNENEGDKKRGGHRKASTKIQDQLNNLFLSSLSFRDARRSKDFSGVQEQLQSLF